MSNYLPHQHPGDCLPIFGRCVAFPPDQRSWPLTGPGQEPRASGTIRVRVLRRTAEQLRVAIAYTVGTPVITGNTPLILPDSLLRNASRIGRAPRFGTSDWPDSLRFDVSVVGPGGTLLPDREVALEVFAVDSAGRSLDSLFGHRHQRATGAVKGAGRLSSQTVTTTAGGAASVTHRSPIVAGPVVLRATSPGAAPMIDTIWVGVPGLVQLVPSVTFDTVGPTVVHPSSNWVTPDMHGLLLQLADSFHATYDKQLGYNDASIRFGGKFDLKLQWGDASPTCVITPRGRPSRPNPWGCHQRHRLGRDVDLRINDLSDEELGKIFARWRRLSGLEPFKEGDHWHLPFRR